MQKVRFLEAAVYMAYIHCLFLITSIFDRRLVTIVIKSWRTILLCTLKVAVEIPLLRT
jgi:hypothetical protein